MARPRWPTGAGAVAAVYAAAAMAWIVLSGLAMPFLPFDASGVEAVEIAKGAAFVAVTGFILWRVLKHQFARLESARARVAALASMAEHSPNAVVALSGEGQVVYANATALAASGGEAVSLLPPDFAARAAGSLRSGMPVSPTDAMAGGRTWRWTFFPRRESAMVFAYGLDRTEAERLGEQVTRAARMETVGRMSAGIAHDFNNMLTAIGGYAELLHGDALEGQVNSADAEEIIRSVDRARTLIQQLMDLSRPRPVDTVTFDLNDAVRDIAALGSRLVPRSLSFEVDLAPGPIPVRFDAGELEQAVLNLLSNAVDATPPGGRITVTTKPGNREAEVVVRDTGAGIQPQHLPLVFDPFFTTKPHGRGTGLGLASVHEIARRHGGHVRVESTVGEGTAFFLTVPLAAESPTGAA